MKSREPGLDSRSDGARLISLQQAAEAGRRQKTVQLRRDGSAVLFMEKYSGEDEMRKFIGVVELRNMSYYNCRLIYEIADGRIFQPSIRELRELLDDSELLNINLGYDRQDGRNMDENFDDHQVIIIEMEKADLIPNVNPYGKVNLTAFKVDALSLLDEGRIRPIDLEHIYYIVEESELDSRLTESELLVINKSYKFSVATEDKIVIRKAESDTIYGPYEVNYRKIDNAHYVNTHIRKNNYILPGYKAADYSRLSVLSPDMNSDEIIGYIAYIEDESRSVTDDVMDDAKLLELVIDDIGKDYIDDETIHIKDIGKILKDYEASMLMAEEIPDFVRQNRMERLSAILGGRRGIDAVYDVLSENIDSLVRLIEKNKDTSEVKSLIKRVISSNPELSGGLSPYLQENSDNLIDVKNSEIEFLKSEVKKLKSELESLNEKSVGENIRRLEKREAEIREEIRRQQEHAAALAVNTKNLEKNFDEKLKNFDDRLYDFALDGFISGRLLEASSQWDKENQAEVYRKAVLQLQDIAASEKEPEELVDYICRLISIERQTYDKNTIINLSICFAQNFLTVLSGEPGCGKTSMCNIFAKVLGLNKLRQFIDADGIEVSRYIPVSVERGWTSKRDFIGYYNPLTKSFDKNNKLVYDAMRIMNEEALSGLSSLPYLILLDEANLSPMEYYWADFMNLCDGIDDTSVVNLGGDHVFRIPETLHFLATINNDHTTATLSPRLLDRAAIVTLPKGKYSDGDITIPNEEIEIISWKSIKKAFFPDFSGIGLSSDFESVYQKIRSHFEKMHTLSPRTEKAVMNYCKTGKQLFEEDLENNRTSEFIALDYGVAQKILPKLTGYGDEYHTWLLHLEKLCSENRLYHSSYILKKIIDKGNVNTRYYQFFG